MRLPQDNIESGMVEGVRGRGKPRISCWFDRSRRGLAYLGSVYCKLLASSMRQSSLENGYSSVQPTAVKWRDMTWPVWASLTPIHVKLRTELMSMEMFTRLCEHVSQLLWAYRDNKLPFQLYYRAMLHRARYCCRMLSVCPSVCLSVCPWRSGIFFTPVRILRK